MHLSFAPWLLGGSAVMMMENSWGHGQASLGCVCVFLNFCTQAYTVVIKMPNDIYEGRYGKQFSGILHNN